MQSRLYAMLALSTILSACADRSVSAPNAVLPGQARLANYETGIFGRSILKYQAYPTGTRELTWFHQGSAVGGVQAGSYMTRLDTPDLTWFSWPGDNYWWTDNTLYRFRFDHFVFGRSRSGCSSWTQTTFATGWSNLGPIDCLPSFVETYYRIEKVRDEFPVAASVSGATTVSTGANGYYASGSGGDGTYTYAWRKSTDGGASWTTVCGTSSFCSQYTVVGDASFILRADVTSWVHTQPTGAYAPSTASAPISVTVAVYTIPTVPPPPPPPPPSDCLQFYGCP